MKFTLQITMANSEGVLERILGKLRQRNFSIHTMIANCSTDLAKIKARITIESQLTSAASITKQLGKLYDVQQLDIVYMENTEEIAPNIRATSTVGAMFGKLTGEQNEVYLSV